MARIWIFLLVSFGYYLTSELSYWISAPERVVVDVWFAAGIGLGAVMITGYWVSPAIIAGTLLFSTRAFLDWNSMTLPSEAMIAAGLVGGVNLVQACMGCFLVKRFDDADGKMRLDTVLSFLRFLVWGAIVPSFFGALFGVASFVALGITDVSAFFYDSFSWWMGNIIGISAIAPVFVVGLNSTNPFSRRVLSFAPVALALLISGVSNAQIFHNYVIREEKAFHEQASQVVSEVRREVQSVADVLPGIAAVFEAEPDLNAKSFQHIAGTAIDRIQAVRAIGWLPVGHAQAAAPELRYLSEGTGRALFERVPSIDNDEVKKVIARSGEIAGVQSLVLNAPLLSSVIPNSTSVLIVYPAFSTDDVQSHRSLIGYVLMEVWPKGLFAKSALGLGPSTQFVVRDLNTNRLEAKSVVSSPATVLKEKMLFTHEGSIDVGGHHWLIQFHRSGDIFSEGVPLMIWLSTLLSAMMIAGISAFSLVLTGQSGALRRLNLELAKRQRKLESLMSTVFDSIIDAVVVTDKTGRIQALNGVAKRMFGVDLDDTQNCPVTSLVDQGQHKRIEEALRDVVESGKAITLPPEEPLRFKTANGRFFPAAVVISPLNTEDSDFALVLVAQDVTEKQLREQAIIEKEAAVKANQTKSQFIATMSHELRTPLNGIIGYAELLLEDEDEGTWEEKSDSYQRIVSSGTTLLSIINSILEISRFEAGTTNLELESVELEELVYDLQTTGSSLAVKRSNTFELECKSEGFIVTDLSKLRKALLNLINNAAKFTESGQIRVTIEDIEEQGEKWLQFAVADTGLGISEDQLDRVFEAFQQVDSSSTRGFDGIGIGLTLTQTLCGLLGGRVEVESTVNVGSTFTVKIPRALSLEAVEERETVGSEG